MLKIFKEWTKFELILYFSSLILTIIVGLVFKSNVISILSTLVAITVIILQAKGKAASNFIGVLLCFLYAYVSYMNKYYGEVIIYIVIQLPLFIVSGISWLKNKSNKTDSVEVNIISGKEWIGVMIGSVLLFIGVYYLLKAFNTNEIMVSTFSVVTGLLAMYVLARRSRYGFIFYIVNDVVLFTLWILPVIKGNTSFLPIIFYTLFALVSDSYGLFNWRRLENKQRR